MQTVHELKQCNAGLNGLSRVAMAGRVAEVKELLAHGGDSGDAIYGYAAGGLHLEVDGLLQSAPHLQVLAIRGYARANDSDGLAPYIKREEPAIRHALARGYAEAGNEAEILALLTTRDGANYLPDIVQGLAAHGDINLLQRFVTNSDLAMLAIYHAARSGHSALVSAMIEDMALDNQAALSHALSGYSKGRHFHLVAPLLKLGLNPMLCLSAIAGSDGLDQSDISALLAAIDDRAVKEKLGKLIERVFN